mmetsp:Transcript_38888/g.93539  ORF Transcript_38888/g.93539 Transcript_38888/m.93539 type:complete len:567 (-) Transcript_38888:354-2054(-)
MSEAPPQYNSQTIIDAAEAKLQDDGVNAAQIVFQSALLDWVDDVTMGDMGSNIDAIREEIANLWMAYAKLNRKSNLNKSATEVYDQATNCPVVGGMGRIWQEYTQFVEERGRPRTAQKLYLRALVGDGGGEGSNGPRVKDPTDQDMLWNSFLRMMQYLKKNPDLTLEDLKKAVNKEHLGQAVEGVEDKTGGEDIPDQQDSSSKADSTGNDTEVARPAKRSRWDQKVPVEIEKVNASSIDTAAGILATTAKSMPPEIETLWHARDGGSLPSRPEPPLFTASPPKLGDPSGKDLVGNATSLKVLKMLTAKTHDGKMLGSALLELCHACWMMTGLKEEEVVKSQESLEKKIIADREAMEADLDARASVAGGALSAVEQANDKERSSFDAQSEAQRQQLLALSAWEFRKILYTHQIILTSAKIPGFEGPTVDSGAIAFQSKVCSLMHSAFYLRARVGETAHLNMLEKQLESLGKIIQTTVKTEPVGKPQYQAPFQMPPMQQFPPPPPFSQPPPMLYAGQPQQQPMMGVTQIPAMPVGLPPHMMQQQSMQPQQFMSQHNPQFQPGQQNNLS